MKLDEAIKHCHEKAKELRIEAIEGRSMYPQKHKAECLECAKEHEQLAEWLTELKERREADRWIPVSERLPEPRVAVEVYCPEYRNQYCAFYDGTHWRVFGTRNTDEVTYWKPLSQVPEESEDK